MKDIRRIVRDRIKNSVRRMYFDAAVQVVNLDSSAAILSNEYLKPVDIE